MKTIIKILTICIFAFILIGCTTKGSEDENIEIDRVIKGESNHWQGSYKVKGYARFGKKDGLITIDSDGSYALTLEYKGDIKELSNMRRLNVSFENSGSSQEWSNQPIEKIFTMKGSLDIIMFNKISKDKGVTINIIWDGNNGNHEAITFK